MQRGRPSSFTPELAAQICELIEDGKTIREIEQMDGMPAWPTIRHWIRTKEDFHTQYARAYELSALSLENQMLEIAKSAHDKDSAAAARVQVDALKWMAGKRNPKAYGDRINMEVTGKLSLEAIVGQAYTAIEGKVSAPTIEGKAEEQDENG